MGKISLLIEQLKEAENIIKGSSEIKLKFCRDNQWALVHDLMNKEREYFEKYKEINSLTDSST